MSDPTPSPTDDDDWEIPYWECPYLARWEERPGHDPEAICAFGCVDEPACVTGGPWPDAGDESMVDLGGGMVVPLQELMEGDA